jgi:hypothetical protein
VSCLSLRTQEALLRAKKLITCREIRERERERERKKAKGCVGRLKLGSSAVQRGHGGVAEFVRL